MRHDRFDKKNTDIDNRDLSCGMYNIDIVCKRHIVFHHEYTFSYHSLNICLDGKLKINRYQGDVLKFSSLVLIVPYLNATGILKISKRLLVFV